MFYMLIILGVGTLVFDTRIGLYDDPPSEVAIKFIHAVHDTFASLHILLFGFVEKSFLPYMDTPAFKKLSKSLDTQNEVAMMYINKKMKELEEMANSDDKSQENQGEVFLIRINGSKIKLEWFS